MLFKFMTKIAFRIDFYFRIRFFRKGITNADYCPMPQLRQQLAARHQCRGPKNKMLTVPKFIQSPQSGRGAESDQGDKARKGNYLCGSARENLRLKNNYFASVRMLSIPHDCFRIL